MTPIDPKLIEAAIRSERLLALSQAKVDVRDVETWNPDLLRDARLLVPVDVQALYVPTRGREQMIRIPMFVSGDGTSDPEKGMPQPFARGTARDPGVHLHWAMPDALLRGKLETRASGSSNRLGLRPLPDRWAVIRVVRPEGARKAHVTGWVIEADRAVAVPLDKWTEGGAPSDVAPAGMPIPKTELTGTVGGSVHWASTYDAVINRFSFHDSLADLRQFDSVGIDQQSATYVVAGWWSDPTLDPLDAARTRSSLDELLHELRWRRLGDWGDARAIQARTLVVEKRREDLGLATGKRFEHSKGVEKGGTPAVASAMVVKAPDAISSSKFEAEAVRRYVTPPWHLRSTLLHGAVLGVPVSGAVPADHRPDQSKLRLAIGRHDDDVLAALATVPGAPGNRRADTERLLGAFTSQKISRLGTPDGVVEIEEHAHASAFASLPAGTEGTDRFLSGERGGSAAVGRKAHRGATVKKGTIQAESEGSRGGLDAGLLYTSHKKSDLVVATEKDVSRSTFRELETIRSTAEARVVARPAPRFAFQADPLLAVQNAGRSLRHGHDGRSSADGKLICRWPTHIISEAGGRVDLTALIPTLGSGSIPVEVLPLVREAFLLDPYHVDWLTEASTPVTQDVPAVRRRLKAEAAMRFGRDGTYDGGTAAFGTGKDESERRWIADELHRFSLFKGADPDPVAVTAWRQPWIPIWLEWEVEVGLPEKPNLEGWALAEVDLERTDDPKAPTASSTFVGRSVITTGAATTLRRAVHDWLAAEDARDEEGPGEANEATEMALRQLAHSVVRSDIVTAAVDGLRLRLLGLPHKDGLHAAANETGVKQIAPVGPPTLLSGGHIVVKRARLLDAFGRVLEVPTNDVAMPVDAQVAGVRNGFHVPPRLTRPARWRFDLVDSASAIGDLTARHARIDQVDPALQVNPVAGFLLPDHLDESLEFFSVDGGPVGELLHEAVGGGVVWEIAAGREGPPDAAPSYGLTTAQQPLAWLAAGVVSSDGHQRKGKTATEESALSALLRTIDTTLWSVDTFSSLGSEHVAGLVGRPIAVVRAQLRLEVKPEDDLDLSDPVRAAERVEAERQIASIAFPVRVGELTRTDDGLLGFFVDDDYTKFRLVDKAIAGLAVSSGRSRGHLGLLGQSPEMPAKVPIHHPYIQGDADADTLLMHIGQTVTLTLLMQPSGKVHLSSGILPRKSLALARDWVGPGLAAIAPSLRTGPVLVETDLADEKQVRLPKVSVFGKNQAFLWRDTPATWRSDAILAATQTALLPDTPAAVREGWIRVVPTLDGGEGGGGS